MSWDEKTFTLLISIILDFSKKVKSKKTNLVLRRQLNCAKQLLCIQAKRMLIILKPKLYLCIWSLQSCSIITGSSIGHFHKNYCFESLKIFSVRISDKNKQCRSYTRIAVLRSWNCSKHWDKVVFPDTIFFKNHVRSNLC